MWETILHMWRVLKQHFTQHFEKKSTKLLINYIYFDEEDKENSTFYAFIFYCSAKSQEHRAKQHKVVVIITHER